MINDKNLQIHLREDYLSDFVEVWLYEEIKGGRNFYNVDTKKELWTCTFVEQGCVMPINLKPFLKMTRGQFDLLSTAMFNLKAKDGMQTKPEQELKGRLEATEKHLSFATTNFDKLINYIVLQKTGD